MPIYNVRFSQNEGWNWHLRSYIGDNLRGRFLAIRNASSRAFFSMGVLGFVIYFFKKKKFTIMAGLPGPVQTCGGNTSFTRPKGSTLISIAPGRQYRRKVSALALETADFPPRDRRLIPLLEYDLLRLEARRPRMSWDPTFEAVWIYVDRARKQVIACAIIGTSRGSPRVN